MKFTKKIVALSLTVLASASIGTTASIAASSSDADYYQSPAISANGQVVSSPKVQTPTTTGNAEDGYNTPEEAKAAAILQASKPIMPATKAAHPGAKAKAGKWVYKYTVEPFSFYQNSVTKKWRTLQTTSTVNHTVNTVIGMNATRGANWNLPYYNAAYAHLMGN